MPGRLELGLEFKHAKTPRPPRGEAMRLLIMGDFGADTTSPRLPLASRPTHRVDADNVDQVMARIGPRLALPDGEVVFGRLDDFHPDQLLERLDVFRALRLARADPSGDQENLLGQLLGSPAVATPDLGKARPAGPVTALDALIRDIVAPHIVSGPSAQSGTRRAAIDAAMAEQLRKLLHNPRFQAIESAWRGVQWVISSLELGEELELHLLDVTREELLSDAIAAKDQLAQAGLFRALVDRWRNQPGGQGWSCLCGLFQFGGSDADVGLLAALGLVSSQAGGPFIATADPAVATGDGALPANWLTLRRSEIAQWIGLAAPRVLMRQPYGRGSDPIESFAFEEFGPGQPAHEELLWGHASLAAAILLGRAFSAQGWGMEPGDEREIEGMPAYTFTKDGEREMQPCAEYHLGEASATAMVGAGLIALLSHRQSNTVTAMRIQSVGDPAQALAGPWS